MFVCNVSEARLENILHYTKAGYITRPVYVAWTILSYRLNRIDCTRLGQFIKEWTKLDNFFINY